MKDGFREWLSDNLRYLLLILVVIVGIVLISFGVRLAGILFPGAKGPDGKEVRQTAANGSKIDSDGLTEAETKALPEIEIITEKTKEAGAEAAAKAGEKSAAASDDSAQTGTGFKEKEEPESGESTAADIRKAAAAEKESGILTQTLPQTEVTGKKTETEKRVSAKTDVNAAKTGEGSGETEKETVSEEKAVAVPLKAAPSSEAGTTAAETNAAEAKTAAQKVTAGGAKTTAAETEAQTDTEKTFASGKEAETETEKTFAAGKEAETDIQKTFAAGKEAETETEKMLAPGKETKTEETAAPGGNTQTQEPSAAQAETETQTNATEAETRSGTDPAAETETEAVTTLAGKTESRPGTAPAAETGTEAASTPSSETDTEKESTAGTGIGKETKATETEKEARAGMALASEAETGAVITTATETETESDAGTTFVSATETGAETTVTERETETDTDTDTETATSAAGTQTGSGPEVLVGVGKGKKEEKEEKATEFEILVKGSRNVKETEEELTEVVTERITEEIDTLSPMEKTEYYAATSLNIRSGPGVDYELLATEESGTPFQVTGETTNWYQVEYDQKTAYISKELLTDVYTPDYRVMNGTCYLRSDSCYGDNIIGEIYGGTEVEFLFNDGGWAYIRVGDQEGYIGARFLPGTGY